MHNEACDAHRELRTHKAKEVTFSDMTLDEARQLHTFDEYFKRETAETVFEKAGKKITPANYAQTECQFRYCGTAIPFLTVRSTAR